MGNDDATHQPPLRCAIPSSRCHRCQPTIERVQGYAKQGHTVPNATFVSPLFYPSATPVLSQGPLVPPPAALGLHMSSYMDAPEQPKSCPELPCCAAPAVLFLLCYTCCAARGFTQCYLELCQSYISQSDHDKQHCMQPGAMHPSSCSSSACCKSVCTLSSSSWQWLSAEVCKLCLLHPVAEYAYTPRLRYYICTLLFELVPDACKG